LRDFVSFHEVTGQRHPTLTGEAVLARHRIDAPLRTDFPVRFSPHA
jgi:hypothetical protein